MARPKLKVIASWLEPVELAFADVISGGEFTVETETGPVRIRKLERPEPIACLPPGSVYSHLDPKANRMFSVISVNSQAVAPDKNGKYVYYRIPDDQGVLFFRRTPIRQH